VEYRQIASLSRIIPFISAPSSYTITVSRQDPQYFLQTPFFYQDQLHSYFIVPVYRFDNAVQLQAHDKIELQFDPALIESTSVEGTLAFRSGSETTNFVNWSNFNVSQIYNWLLPNLQFVPSYSFNVAKHYHPYVCDFMKALNKDGIAGLLSGANQKLIETRPIFSQDYLPILVNQPFPVEDVEFDASDDEAAVYRNLPYGVYNWELFFHAPLLIATRLSKNQRFESAAKWFHYIFNPTNSDSAEPAPQRYWNVLPFKSSPQDNILSFMGALNTAQGDPNNGLNQEVDAWTKHPFDPHLIARRRRIAYQKNVFMKYVDNLIAWGDQLFSQDTIEAINEATQLYVLASDLLGPRPQEIPQRGKIADETYATLQGKLDEFANALVTLENEFPFTGNSAPAVSPGTQTGGLLGLGTTLFFCVPNNDKLLGYWDTVADRLFKIRNCMNIAGVVRQLPLFEPPIDPALLVQAAAAGVDLGSVLSDVNSALPLYRFTYTLQKASEICSEVKSLGASLLSVLEKADAETLAAMRAGHETQLFTLIKAVKQQQFDEALASADALQKSREAALGRYNYYQLLLGQTQDTPDFGASIPLTAVSNDLASSDSAGFKLLKTESSELDLMGSASDHQAQASDSDFLASVLQLFPNFSFPIGPPLSGFSATAGGSNIGPAPSAIAHKHRSLSTQDTHNATVSSRLGGYARREQEWTNQRNNAAREIMQIDKQIAAAKIRADIAQGEITNQQTQIDNSKQVEDFLRDKFINQELFGWMSGQVSSVYFQAYQMAYDLAKKAERAFRFERGLTTSSFIQFGYWDSLRKGLLAGEQLHLALKQMERAFLDQNKREYEITRHVSLQLFDPMALISLKETGHCEIELPETFFDSDYPGHFMRRLKSVSLTLPCVVGPYTSINCTLTLLSNKTRVQSTLLGGQYEEDTQQEDPRFVANFAALQSIATSHAQNDSGLFELNFRDERYLPFEGAGAISRWRIDLPKDNNAFDFNTLSDVIIHMKYTAREGGDILKNAAKKAMQDAIADAEQNLLARFFNIKHEFPTEWQRFLTAADDTGDHIQTLKIPKDRFPFLFQGRIITINRIDLFGVPQIGKQVSDVPALTLPDQQQAQLKDGVSLGQLLHKLADSLSINVESDESKAVWTLRVSKDNVKNVFESLDDILLVCHYTINK
jgi:hypothetical protein